MNASHPDLSVSSVGLAALFLFIGVFGSLHVLVAKKKAPPRRRYFIYLSIAFFVTLFIPVVDGGAKFGWLPVSAAYLLIPSSIFLSTDDLFGIFALCYGIVAAHQLLCIGAASILTQRRKNALAQI